MDKISKDVIEFWNKAIKLEEEDKKEIENSGDKDYTKLAPSLKLYEAVKELGKCGKVLDYGCGSGWSSIIALKEGAKEVDAVDMGDNIIDAINFYAKYYGVASSLNAKKIDSNYLKSVNDATYDGIIINNVLDVIPLDITLEILNEVRRVAKNGARIIIGLNFYMPLDAAKARGLELVDGRMLFVDGVLRLYSMSDSEWTEILTKYFEIERLDHFAWEGESRETRRLFILKKTVSSTK